MTKPAPGYHLAAIPQGELGEVSKILEEALELQDAHDQGVRVMCLVELSDLVGAIEAYLKRHHPQTSWEDLHAMARVTARAFINGARPKKSSPSAQTQPHPPAPHIIPVAPTQPLKTKPQKSKPKKAKSKQK